MNIADGRKTRESDADGRYVGHEAVASADGVTWLEVSAFTGLKIHHASSNETIQLTSLHAYDVNAVEGMALSRDGKVGALASTNHYLGQKPANRRINTWDLISGKETHQWCLKKEINGLALTPDGGLLASCNGNQIQIWDRRTGKEVGAPLLVASVPPERTKVPMAFSTDGKLLAAGRDRIEVWDVASRARRYQLSGHRGPINCLAFDGTSRYLASESDDTTALVWDLSQLGTSSGAKLR
jgi:WD40 repeat protein